MISYQPTTTAGIYQDDEGNLAVAITTEQAEALLGTGAVRYACDGQAVAMLDAQIEK
jgi:hypothetical protein